MVGEVLQGESFPKFAFGKYGIDECPEMRIQSP